MNFSSFQVSNVLLLNRRVGLITILSSPSVGQDLCQSLICRLYFEEFSDEQGGLFVQVQIQPIKIDQEQRK